MESKNTVFGFQFGPANVTRLCHDDPKGWVILGIRTPKCDLHMYVTKTGEVTLSYYTGEVVWRSHPRNHK